MDATGAGGVLVTGTNHLKIGPMQAGDEVVLEDVNLGKLSDDGEDTVSLAQVMGPSDGSGSACW
jgi:hypothetical protein